MRKHVAKNPDGDRTTLGRRWEVASVLLPTFGAPDWVMKAFSALVILGFPLALILAWAFELTPEGFKRETAVDPDESITHVTGRRLDFAIIGLLVLAVGFTPGSAVAAS